MFICEQNRRVFILPKLVTFPFSSQLDIPSAYILRGRECFAGARRVDLRKLETRATPVVG